MGENITFVGLDVHKTMIAVFVAEAGRDGEVRFVGEIPNEPAALDKVVARRGRGSRTLRFVYEAGPTTGERQRIGVGPRGQATNRLLAGWAREVCPSGGRRRAITGEALHQVHDIEDPKRLAHKCDVA